MDCLNCGGLITKRKNKKFCCHKCASIYRKDHHLMSHIQRKAGWHHTKATKEQISNSCKNLKQTLGHTLTLEHRVKISKGLGGTGIEVIETGKNVNGYAPSFSKQVKEQARVRDRFICQSCGIPELEFDRNLDVHHKDHNKENCSLDNLITLCRGCHLRLHRLHNTKSCKSLVEEDF